MESSTPQWASRCHEPSPLSPGGDTRAVPDYGVCAPLLSASTRPSAAAAPRLAAAPKAAHRVAFFVSEEKPGQTPLKNGVCPGFSVLTPPRIRMMAFGAHSTRTDRADRALRPDRAADAADRPRRPGKACALASRPCQSGGWRRPTGCFSGPSVAEGPPGPTRYRRRSRPDHPAESGACTSCRPCRRWRRCPRQPGTQGRNEIEFWCRSLHGSIARGTEFGTDVGVG